MQDASVSARLVPVTLLSRFLTAVTIALALTLMARCGTADLHLCSGATTSGVLARDVSMLLTAEGVSVLVAPSTCGMFVGSAMACTSERAPVDCCILKRQGDVALLLFTVLGRVIIDADLTRIPEHV